MAIIYPAIRRSSSTVQIVHAQIANWSASMILLAVRQYLFFAPEIMFHLSEIDCQWSPWTAWTDCHGSCDSSKQSRSRTILNAPAYGGRRCNANGNTDIRSCPNTCICQWSDWSRWTNCSRPCGGGSTNRTRTPLNKWCDKSRDSPISIGSCNDVPCRNETTSNILVSLSLPVSLLVVQVPSVAETRPWSPVTIRLVQGHAWIFRRRIIIVKNLPIA